MAQRTIPSNRRVVQDGGNAGVYKEQLKLSTDTWADVDGVRVLSAFSDGDIVVLPQMDNIVLVYEASSLRFYDVGLSATGTSGSSSGGFFDNATQVQWTLESAEDTTEEVEAELPSGDSVVRRYKVYSAEVSAGFLSLQLAQAITINSASGVLPRAATIGTIQNTTKRVTRDGDAGQYRVNFVLEARILIGTRTLARATGGG